MAESESQIDTTLEIVTPENIAFQYEMAGPFRRLPAFLVDFLLRVVIIIAMVMFITLAGIFGAAASTTMTAMIMLTYFVLEWFYGGVLETVWNGQTVGKRMMGIRVLSHNGQPINGLQAILRNLFRLADMMPLFPLSVLAGEDAGSSVFAFPTCMIGLLFCALTKRSRRLGDLVSGTIVVVEERQPIYSASVRLDDPRTSQLAELLPKTLVVSKKMTRALAAYLERRSYLTPARRHEIARHLAEPLIEICRLPADTNHDLLLCALYYRTFVAQGGTQDLDAVDEYPFATTAQTRTNAATAPQEPISS